MASPITITTTPVVIRPVIMSRDVIILQNNGKNDVYLKKIIPGQHITNPSITSYDYKLGGATGEGHDGDILTLKSVAKFIGVTDKGSSDVAVMETFFI